MRPLVKWKCFAVRTRRLCVDSPLSSERLDWRQDFTLSEAAKEFR